MSIETQIENNGASGPSSVVDPFAPRAPLGAAELDPPAPEVKISRDSVQELLVESVEIATARKPVRLMLTISRNVDGKKIQTQKSIDIYIRDRQAPAGTLKLLGQELAMFKGDWFPSGEAPIQTVDDDLAWKMLEGYRARALQSRKEREEAERREAEGDRDL